ESPRSSNRGDRSGGVVQAGIRSPKPWVAGGKSPEPRRGERKDKTGAIRSFVPDGTRFLFASQPSDESLDYSRTSLRDVDSRQAKHIPPRCAARAPYQARNV